MLDIFDFKINYTLAFCMTDNNVLMLLRKRPPNQNKWNGLGGKIEKGETPDFNIKRELLEEAGIKVVVAKQNYKGIVKWIAPDRNIIGGTHLYFFDLPKLPRFENQVKTDEGILHLQSKNWVLDKQNSELVSNIPIFFEHAVETDLPQIYEFIYDVQDEIKDFRVLKL